MTNDCVPTDPTKAGAHWLQFEDDRQVVCWRPTGASEHIGMWVGYWHPMEMHRRGYRYLRPVVSPQQEDALHAEIDEMSTTVAEQTRANEALRRHNEKLITEADRLFATNSALNDMVQRERDTVGQLRQRITELATALDERASEMQEREWRVL